MIFSRLEIENFGSIQKIVLNLEKQGLVLITGENKDTNKADSNGAGKSLLLEAFCWCLWGKTIRGLRGDDVVNKKVGKDCKVTLTFYEGDDKYRVVRTRKMSGPEKANDLRVYVTAGPTRGEIDLTGASMSNTQEHIDELIGMDYDLFQVLMPGAGKRASEMTDKEIKSILESLLRTDILAKSHYIVKDQLKKLQQDLKIKLTQKDSLDEAISNLEESLVEFIQKSNNFDVDKQVKLEKLKSTLKTKTQELNEQVTIIGKASKAKDELAKVQGRLEPILNQIYFLQDSIKASEQAHNAGRDGHNVKSGVMHQKIEALNEQIRDLPEGDCITCHQSITDEYRAKITEDLEAERNELMLEYADLIEAREKKDEAHKAFIESKQQQISKLRAEEALVQVDVKKFNNLIQEGKTASRLRLHIKKNIEEIEQSIEDIKGEEDPFQSLIEKTCTTAFETTSKACKLLKEIKMLEHKEELLKYWLHGFSPQGVRSFMLEHVTPLLNHAAEKYSRLLTDGEMSVTFNTQHTQKSGKVVEKFNIQVEHDHGGDSYVASSAGERSRANLVTAFALGDLAALRANKTISFRFLDEPFENVDESGTEAIVSLLNDQRERFETVFVITHQDHFKQLFPKRLTVVKKNGFTNLEVANA